MLVTLAGAMSTAEIGMSLAEMIREGKVHAISCTGANLEEDIFNLVAHDYYRRLPHYRELSAKDEEELMVRHLYRVTDTCIPEEEAVRPLEKALLNEWQRAEEKGKPDFPHEFLYRILLADTLKDYYQIDPKDSWVLAAAQKDLPIFVPGWEDSTLGNTFASHVIKKEIKNVHTVRTGIEYMVELADWYQATCREHSMGFFQIGGGIAGDFPICVVPMLEQSLKSTMFRAGVISARSATRPRATGRTRVLFQTRRSHGASFRQRHRSSLSSQTPPSWHRSFSPMSWANSWWACPCWLAAGKIECRSK